MRVCFKLYVVICKLYFVVCCVVCLDFDMCFVLILFLGTVLYTTSTSPCLSLRVGSSYFVSLGVDISGGQKTKYTFSRYDTV